MPVDESVEGGLATGRPPPVKGQRILLGIAKGVQKLGPRNRYAFVEGDIEEDSEGRLFFYKKRLLQKNRRG